MPPHLGPPTEALTLWLALWARTDAPPSPVWKPSVMEWQRSARQRRQNGLALRNAGYDDPDARWNRFLCGRTAFSAPRRQGQAGYQSVLSQLIAPSPARCVYWTSIGSIHCAGALGQYRLCRFPRLASRLSRPRLPPSWINAPRSPSSIPREDTRFPWWRACCSSFFKASPTAIPLYAVGAFTAFTLSQAGMVVHWQRHPGPGAPQYVRQRARLVRHGPDNYRRPGREVHRGRMDRRDPHPQPDLSHVDGEAPLQQRGAGDQPGRAGDTANIPAPITVLTIDRWNRIAKSASTPGPST